MEVSTNGTLSQILRSKQNQQKFLDSLKMSVGYMVFKTGDHWDKTAEFHVVAHEEIVATFKKKRDVMKFLTENRL